MKTAPTLALAKPLVGAAVLLSLLVLSQAGEAIIIRHDRADSRYVVNEVDFPQIFSIHYRFDNRVCMASLIAARWAITAGHCTDETPLGETLARREPYRVSIAGEDYAAVAMVLHPDYREDDPPHSVDLALLRLDRPVTGVAPLRLNRQRGEQDRVAMFLGWGFTGLGTLGRQGNDGHFRHAYNRVLEAGRWLTFRFDDPRDSSSGALPLEGVPGLGDSGGPALLQSDKGPVLAGVALGEIIDPEQPDAAQGRYGAIEIYERISSHLTWIDAHIRADALPTPEALSAR